MPKTTTEAEEAELSKAEAAALAKRLAPIEKLMGSCSTAKLISSGAVGSTTPVEEWHAKCKGGHLDGRGRFTRCTCQCHADQHVCIRCGATATELDDQLSCVDVEGCVAEYRRQLLADPTYQRFTGYLEAGANARAEAAAEEKRAVAAGEKPPKVKSGKKPQPCQHGCGEMTKGGLFVMGHDAKLKGILMRAAESGDIESLTELSLRSWLPSTGRGRDRYTAADLARADERVAETNTEAFLAARVAERTAKAAELGDVELATRTIGGVA